MGDVGLIDQLADLREYLQRNTLFAYQLVFDALHVCPGADHGAVVTTNPEVNDEPPVSRFVRELDRVTIVQDAVWAEAVAIPVIARHLLGSRISTLPLTERLARQLL